MRTILLIALPILFLLSSCKKDDTKDTSPEENANFINTASGSSWVYHEVNASGVTTLESDYTITSSNRDTTISSRTYHIYNVSYGANRYLNISGKEYYQFDTIPGGGSKTIHRLYLKTGLQTGANWTQSENIEVDGFQVPVKISNTIVETSLTRIVNGKTYQKVIHVSTKITSDLIPAASLSSDIQSYYAPNYGLIENTSKINLNYLGVVEKVDISTTLKTADLK